MISNPSIEVQTTSENRCSVPACRSMTSQPTAHASPMRHAVAAMNVVMSGSAQRAERGSASSLEWKSRICAPERAQIDVEAPVAQLDRAPAF